MPIRLGYSAPSIGTTVNLKQYARGDGITDDTEAFTIAVAAAYGRVLEVPYGTYLISTITLTDDIEIMGDGLGSVIKRKDNTITNTNLFLCSGNGKRFVFHDLTFDGNQINQPVPASQSSIRMPSVGTVNSRTILDVKNCWFINGSGNSDIDIFNDTDTSTVETVCIKNNYFIGGRECTAGNIDNTSGYIQIRSPIEGEIIGNVLDLGHAPATPIGGRKGIHIGITAGTAAIGARLVVANNTLNYCGILPTSGGGIGSIDFYSFGTDAIIANNIVRNCVTRAIDVKADSRNIVVSGNVIEGHEVDGDGHIILNRTTSAFVNGNWTITGNVSDGSLGYGIALNGGSTEVSDFATVATVTGNTVKNCVSRGINVANMETANIVGNVIDGAVVGLGTATVTEMLNVSDNQFSNLTSNAIFIDSGCTTAVVNLQDNQINAPAAAAILIQKCAGGIISGNTAINMPGSFQFVNLTDIGGPMVVTGNTSDSAAPLAVAGTNPHLWIYDNAFATAATAAIHKATIASGVITATMGFHYVEGEGGASDTLDTINGAIDGRVIVLYPNNTANTITLSSSGNIVTTGGPTTLDANVISITLQYANGKWRCPAALVVSSLADNVGQGHAANGQINLRMTSNITGNATSYGIYQDGSIQSDVTASANYHYVQSNIAAASTVGTLSLFRASQGTFGAGSTVTTQQAFVVDSSLTSAANNRGFVGALAATTSTYNLYMSGNADNALAGNLRIGSVVAPTVALDVTGQGKFSGLLTTVASASGGSGLRLPHGAAPSSPVDGDMWTTSSGLFVRINGTTVGPLS